MIAFCTGQKPTQLTVPSCKMTSTNFSPGCSLAKPVQFQEVPHPLHYQAEIQAGNHLHTWSRNSIARRTNFRLVNFYKAETALSTSHLQKPSRCTRNSDETTFIPLSSRTNPRKYSFFSTYHHQLKPAVTWPAPQTYSWVIPAIPRHLINNNFQPWHSSDNGCKPIAGRPLKNPIAAVLSPVVHRLWPRLMWRPFNWWQCNTHRRTWIS